MEDKKKLLLLICDNQKRLQLFKNGNYIGTENFLSPVVYSAPSAVHGLLLVSKNLRSPHIHSRLE